MIADAIEKNTPLIRCLVTFTNKNNTFVILGKNDIANFHARELNNLSYKTLFYSKTFKKTFSSLNVIKHSKFKFFLICSPNRYHLKHFYLINNVSRIIIIEKPLFWDFSLTEKNNFRKIFYFIKANKNFILNDSSKFLVRQIIQTFKVKKKTIRNVEIEYYTKSEYLYNEILIDLLPHAIDMIYEISNCNDSNFFHINKKKINKYYSNIEINYKNIFLKIILGSNRKKTKINFKFDDLIIKRKIIIENDKPNIYLISNNLSINTIIQNPLCLFHENLKKNYYKPSKNQNDIYLDKYLFFQRILSC